MTHGNMKFPLLVEYLMVFIIIESVQMSFSRSKEEDCQTVYKDIQHSIILKHCKECLFISVVFESQRFDFLKFLGFYFLGFSNCNIRIQ